MASTALGIAEHVAQVGGVGPPRDHRRVAGPPRPLRAAKADLARLAEEAVQQGVDVFMRRAWTGTKG
jgi:hypothetical protein